MTIFFRFKFYNLSKTNKHLYESLRFVVSVWLGADQLWQANTGFIKAATFDRRSRWQRVTFHKWRLLW